MNFNAERDRKAEGMRAIKEGKMPDKLTQKTSKLRASRCAAVKENLHSMSSESFFLVILPPFNSLLPSALRHCSVLLFSSPVLLKFTAFSVLFSLISLARSCSQSSLLLF